MKYTCKKCHELKDQNKYTYHEFMYRTTKGRRTICKECETTVRPYKRNPHSTTRNKSLEKDARECEWRRQTLEQQQYAELDYGI